MFKLESKTITHKHRIVAMLLLAAGLVFAYSPSTQAATISLSGSCNLDNAILSANNNTSTGGCTAGDPGLDVIDIPAGTVTLTADPVEYTESIHVQGAGSSASIIDANHSASYAFSNKSTMVVGVDLTVQNVGFSDFGVMGDAMNLLFNNSTGSTTIDQVTVTDTLIPGTSLPVETSSIVTSNGSTLSINGINIVDTVINATTDKVQFVVAAAPPVTSATVSGLHVSGTTNVQSSSSQEIEISLFLFNSLQTFDGQDISLTDSNIQVAGTNSSVDMLGMQAYAQSMTTFKRFRLANNTIQSNSTEGHIAMVGILSILYDQTISDIDMSNNTLSLGDLATQDNYTNLVGYLAQNIETPVANTVRLNNMSFNNNVSDDEAGFSFPIYALCKGDVDMQISNTTISNNTAINGLLLGEDLGGGGPLVDCTGSFALDNITIADNIFYTGLGPLGSSQPNGAINHIGTNLEIPDTELSLQNVILSGNTLDGSDSNCDSRYFPNSLGNNLSSDSTCSGEFNQAGDINGEDPLLNSLSTPAGSFGGMRTLQAGSPAIDAGKTIQSVATDQRGQARPQGSAFDIGAHEYVLSTTTVSPDSDVAAPNTGVYTKVTKSSLVLIVTFVVGGYAFRRRISGFNISKNSFLQTNKFVGKFISKKRPN